MWRLPDEFAENEERLARFKREAKVLASLNHPNIASIYGLEQFDNTHYLVLELVPGETLAERISRGPIPLEEALDIATKMAEALEEAHEQGIVHRDLKPANVKQTEDGKIKVLDYGLAKVFQEETPDADSSMSPTLTRDATRVGVILGTAAYMSPEQAKGKKVDKRADVWAFGVVLYEMLTGKRAFSGEDVSDTLAAVLRSEPDWDALPAETDGALRSILRLCLTKDVKLRVRDIGDVRLAMEGAFATSVPQPAEAAVAPQLQAWQRPAPLALAGLALIVASSLAVWTLTRPDVIPADLMRFVIVPPDTAPLNFFGPWQDLAISPDGTQVVYKGPDPSGSAPQLNLRPIDQLVGAPLRGGEGGLGPFVSPDGEWVGFVASSSRTLRKVSIFGGPPVTLTESPNTIIGASWGADDQIVFGTSAGLFRVSGGGGEPEALTTLDADQGEQNHLWPFIIPGREAVLFAIGTGSPLTTGQLAVVDLDTGDVTRLGLAGVSPHYVSTGHLVYAAEDGSVRAVPFDATSLEVIGSPVPLVEGVMVKRSGAADFSISDNGRLVYALGAGGGGGQRSLVWVDRDGREEAISDRRGDFRAVRLSPDGRRVALEVAEENLLNIWILGIEDDTFAPLNNEGISQAPLWTPDGEKVLFNWAEGGGGASGAAFGGIYWRDANFGAEREQVLQADGGTFPLSWSDDGEDLVLHEMIDGQQGQRRILVMPIEGADRTPYSPLDPSGQFNQRSPMVSPDGRWVAYMSTQSGRDEVYVRPFPEGGRRAQISNNGGVEPMWGADSSELFYREIDGATTTMIVAQLRTGPELRVAGREALFSGDYYFMGNWARTVYDYDRQSDRFLVVTPDDGQAGDSLKISVVLNWFEELKARVPTHN